MQGREQLLSFPRESCSSGDFGLWLLLSTCLLPQHCLVVLKIVINWEVRAQVTQTWPHSNQQIPGIRFHRRTEAITSNSYLEWKGYFQRLERKWTRSRDPPNLSGSDTAWHTSTTAGSLQGGQASRTPPAWAPRAHSNSAQPSLAPSWSPREQPLAEKCRWQCHTRDRQEQEASPNKHVPLGKDMKEQEPSHSDDSYTKLPTRKSSFHSHVSPTSNHSLQDSQKTKFRTILSSLFTNHLGWGKRQNFFPFFSKGNSNVLGEKGGRIQGKKGFPGSYEKHSSSMNTTMKIKFLKKYNWHPFDLIYIKKICFCLPSSGLSVIYSLLFWRHLLCFSPFLPFFWY